MAKTKRRAKIIIKKKVSRHDPEFNSSYIVDYSKSGKDNKSQRENTYSKRMKPYSRRRGKFAVEPADRTGISTLGKLITKNANRSLKKSVRQTLKKQLKEEIEQW